VPESRKRKKPAHSSRPAAGAAVAKKKGPSPRWLPALMVVLFGIGMLWLVVFYLTEARMGGLPGASDIGNWNLLVGFAFIIVGFALATQWR
jgi:Cell division protein CrgA